MKKLVFLLGFLSLIINSTAQEPMSCTMLGDTTNVLPMGFLKNRSNKNNTPKVIPVVVHIVYTEYSKAKGQSLWNSVNILFDLIFR